METNDYLSGQVDYWHSRAEAAERASRAPDPTAEALARAVEDCDADGDWETAWDIVLERLRAYREAHPREEGK